MKLLYIDIYGFINSLLIQKKYLLSTYIWEIKK